MEIFLNLVWASLSLLGICLWVRWGDRPDTRRYLPLVALAMLLVILFPVVSVSDDLWSIQNPAETDSCQRRDQAGLLMHPVPQVLAAPVVFLLAPLDREVQLVAATSSQPLVTYMDPALDGIENRPPPAA